MKLTEHFSLEELIKSSTAKAKKIDNTPTQAAKTNLQHLASNILEPIRLKYNKPIIVTSGYRSMALNKAVGGSKTSQHLLGQAADIKAPHNENKALFQLIEKMVKAGEIQVGQLIDEYGYKWIHVSLPRTNKPNNQILHLS